MNVNEGYRGGGAVGRDRAVGVMIWLLGLAIFINYVDRGMLGIAAPRLKADLGLTASEYGLAASAFFWVYAPGQLVAGWLVGRVNAAWLLAAGLGFWGLATALTGLAGGLVTLIGLRLLLGAGEAVAFPAAFKLIVDHVAESRRGAANAGLSIGIALGPALGTLGGGLVLAALGWRWLFLGVGLLTLVWLLPWVLTMRRMPAPAQLGTGEGPHYVEMLACRAMLAMALVQICWAYGLYFLVTWLPLWLVEQRGYSLADMAWIGSVAFVGQALAALVCGQANDRLLRRGVPLDRVRRGGAVLGLSCIAAGLALVPLAEQRTALVAALFLAGCGIGMAHISLNMMAQVFAGPLAVGKWVGVGNGFGNIAGIINPLITGAIVDATGSFHGAFVLAAIVPICGVFGVLALVPRVAPILWAGQPASNASVRASGVP